MADHATFAPSGASTWMNCPAVIRWASKFYRKPSGPAALEGTALHEEAAACLIKGKYATNPKFRSYVATVLNKWRDIGGDLWVEEKVKVPKVEKQVWGTLDAAIITKKELWEYDYKSGRNPVSPTENKQLLTYAVGLPRRAKTFLAICQRNEPAKVWHTDSNRVQVHHEAILVAVKEAMSDPVMAVPGKWCEYCRAKMFCPGFLRKRPMEVKP